ncbi:hypothetical protein HMPREF1990_01950 [Porphyromonas gingivalis W4087]|nr:hypothetical protein HMPREF1990_01950 [Porphyromonas gingivalis W4087]
MISNIYSDFAHTTKASGQTAPVHSFICYPLIRRKRHRAHEA